jgi:hypothetical protein
LIKLVTLSGISVQSTTSPSNLEDPINLTGETQPIPVYRSGSGDYRPIPTAQDLNSPKSSPPTEANFYQLALYVDNVCRVESCLAFPQGGENEIVVLGRCLRDLHAKVARQLWIRQGVVRAVQNGFRSGGVGFVSGSVGGYGGIMMGQGGMQWISRDEQEGEVLKW